MIVLDISMSRTIALLHPPFDTVIYHEETGYFLIGVGIEMGQEFFHSSGDRLPYNCAHVYRGLGNQECSPVC